MGEPGETEAGIPTQRITLVAEERWFGSIPSRFTVFKTGSDSRWIEDDPPYKPGETYALYLTERDDGAYLPVAPDGRVKIVDGKAEPLIPGPVAEEIEGDSAESLENQSTTAQGDQ